MNILSLRRLPSLLTLLLFLPSLSHAATRKVPSQYPTIQAGINAAQSGDTVLVADGTYTGNGNRDLDFFGKSLTVKSEHGAASAIIDCQGTRETPHRGFSNSSRIEQIIIIDGLTVKHGVASGRLGSSGGGTYLSGDRMTATVRNCTFSNNTASATGNIPAYAQGEGGGVCIHGKSAIVTNCTFSNNIASGTSDGLGSSGGGASIFCSSATVTNCTFSGNTASGYRSTGGGADIESDPSTSSSAMITNCAFRNNTANASSGNSGAGGADISGSSVMVINCSFSGNTTTAAGNGNGYGGGAYIYGSFTDATVTNCVFSNNKVSGHSSYGGGACIVDSGFRNSNATATNCTFNSNTAIGNGSAASGTGGGVCMSGSNMAVTNCIAWGDQATISNEISFIPNNSNPTGAVAYSDVQGSYAGVGNINKDPKFVNAATGDLHLQVGSPCLGAGTPNGAPATDRDGKTRPYPPSMGAYDIEPAIMTLTLTPSSVYGGQDSIGTVTLSVPAPSGGAVVSLTSNTAVALIPARVTIAAGQTKTTFTVTTKPVTATTTSTIRATYNGSTKYANLISYPAALASLTVSPTTVKGGGTATATVRMTSPAPADGAKIYIYSNTAAALIPAIVTIPAGARSLTFTVKTNRVTAKMVTTIKASCRTGSVYAFLTVTP